MGYTTITPNVLEQDIELIMRSEYQDIKALQYSIMLHTVDIDLDIVLLESIEVLGDYINNITDHTIVNFKMPLGDYIYDILPHNHNLEISIKVKWYDKSCIIRNKFILSSNTGGVTNTSYDSMSRESLNEKELVHVEGQCLDRYIEILRTTVSDGIYNYTNVSDLMKITLTEKLKEVVVEGVSVGYEAGDYLINIHEPDNKEVYRHINIPFGTNVYDIPSYLQDTNYGVYNEDLGTYQQDTNLTKIVNNRLSPKTSFYVYPLYNSVRYDSDKGKKLLIMSHPTNKYQHSEHNHTVDGDIIKIVSSGTPKNYDNGDNDAINKGNVIVSTDPSYIVGRNTLISDAGVQNDPTLNVSARVKSERSDGVNNYKYVDTHSNMFKHRSNIIQQNFVMYQVQWDYSNPDLLYPGMPVALVFKDKTGIVRLTGTLVLSYSKYDNINKMTSSLLNVMLNKQG